MLAACRGPARISGVAYYLATRNKTMKKQTNEGEADTKQTMGKCKFADSWLEMDEFKLWLKPLAGNIWEAYCSYCKKKTSVVSMVINAMRSHMHGSSHKTAVSGTGQQWSITGFCAQPATATTTPQPSNCSTTA